MKRYSARCSARYSARGCVAVGNARGRVQRKRAEVEGRGLKTIQDLSMHRYVATARVRVECMRGATR